MNGMAEGHLESVDQARNLVRALNAPGNASIAKSIQEELQALQKSDAGWIVADGLVNSEEADARFFGALTLTIKIHQDWNSLSEEDKISLLVRLIDFLIMLINRSEIPVVMRKFMTTLSTFFLKTNAPWTLCIRTIALSLAQGHFVPEDQCTAGIFSQAVSSLGFEHLATLLSFSTTLAEESLRCLVTNDEVRSRLSPNLRDAAQVIDFVFQGALDKDPGYISQSNNVSTTVSEALASLEAWLTSRLCRVSLEELREIVATPISHAIQLLIVPSLAATIMGLLTEMLQNQPRIITKDQMSSVEAFLAGPHGEQYSLALLKGEDEDEPMRFLDLLLRYASVEQAKLFIQPLTEQSERILFLLHALFKCPGYAAIDDKACSYLLEYWAEVADDLGDEIMQNDIEFSPDRLKAQFRQVIGDVYNKLLYPEDTLRELDEDDVRNFASFRRDFSDFLTSVYPMLGLDLVQQLQQHAFIATNAQDWQCFEVAIFCLSFLGDSVSELPCVDDLLHGIFYSPILDDICFNRLPIPAKSRQSLCDMIARYTWYFQRNSGLLPRTLNFLFNSLDHPGCDQAASKSISTMCGNCRQGLGVYVGDFISQFHKLRLASTSEDSTSLQRVAEGIAAVIQGVSSETEKAEALTKLLGPLQQSVEQAGQDVGRGLVEEALTHGVTAIRCTASIGKGFRAPDDMIDLEAESFNDTTTGAFWSPGGPGGTPQACIIRIIDLLVTLFPSDGDIIEAACDVLRAGYTENHHGPYVLSPEVTVRFVRAANMTTPRFATVMATASAFLASNAWPTALLEHEAVPLLVAHVYEIAAYMAASPAEQYDPEVAHACLDFLTGLLSRHHGAFFRLTADPATSCVVPGLVSFSLDVLARADPLPLRAAAMFWAALLASPELPGTWQSDVLGGAPGPWPSLGSSNSYFDRCLEALSRVIVHQVCGNSARSDLDHLSEVLKKFVFRHQGAAKVHLGRALASPEARSLVGQGSHFAGSVSVSASVSSEASTGPSAAERERFLASLLALRGGRRTNALVKEWWVTCRGRGFAYTS